MAKKRDAYVIDGKHVPGVSAVKGVLDKPYLIPWACKKMAEYLEENWKPNVAYQQYDIIGHLQAGKKQWRVARDSAGDFGDNVHELVGSYIEGQLTPDMVMDPKERKALENFILVTKGWKWHASEVVVLNKKYGFGGTSDGLASLPSGMVIIPDVKTSNSTGPDHTLQIAMYSHPDSVPSNPDDPALEKLLRELWPQIQEGRILHFNKDRLTWECLERDVKSHWPYVEHFRKVLEWKDKFDPPNFSEYGGTQNAAPIIFDKEPPANSVHFA